jgi:hypothetical protein
MKYVLDSVTNAQPDNLRAGLSSHGKIDDYHKVWDYIYNPHFINNCKVC